MLTFLTAIAVSFTSYSAALPKCITTLKGEDTPKYTRLDFMMSDLEGGFFALLEMAQSAAAEAPANAELFAKRYLSAKAEIFNDINQLLPLVMKGPIPLERKNAMALSLFQILDSLGAPILSYGFELSEEGNLSHKGMKVYSPQQIASLREKALAQMNLPGKPFGFTPIAGPNRDLSMHQHRSIGFKEQVVENYEAPKRQVGQFTRGWSADKTNLVVTDTETQNVYSVPFGMLASGMIRTTSEQHKLEFNQDIKEWVVTKVNLNNPTGRIGF